jgi:hypothetical protein
MLCPAVSVVGRILPSCHLTRQNGRQNGSTESGSAEFGTLYRQAELETQSDVMNYSKFSVFLAELFAHSSHFLIGHKPGSLGSVVRGELVNFTGLDQGVSKRTDKEIITVGGGRAASI